MITQLIISSLHLFKQKSTKSLDTCERTENNNKPFKTLLSLDNSKLAVTTPAAMGTKEASETAKTAENGRKLAVSAGNGAAKTPSPTATANEQNTRKSPRDELTNGGSSSSGKSTSSSPLGGNGSVSLSGSDATSNDGQVAVKNRLSADGVRNINNNQDNGNANENGADAATTKSNAMDKKSPANGVAEGNASLQTVGRMDTKRKSTDGDNNVNVLENGDGGKEYRIYVGNKICKSIRN